MRTGREEVGGRGRADLRGFAANARVRRRAVVARVADLGAARRASAVTANLAEARPAVRGRAASGRTGLVARVQAQAAHGEVRLDRLDGRAADFAAARAAVVTRGAALRTFRRGHAERLVVVGATDVAAGALFIAAAEVERPVRLGADVGGRKGDGQAELTLGRIAFRVSAAETRTGRSRPADAACVTQVAAELPHARVTLRVRGAGFLARIGTDTLPGWRANGVTTTAALTVARVLAATAAETSDRHQQRGSKHQESRRNRSKIHH